MTSNEKLNISSLQDAINSMKNAIRVYESLKDMGEDERVVLRAGVIQNFEFTYELGWKFMKRWIEMNISPIAVDGVTRRELFRQAAENKLIVDVDKWMDFHKDRNRTSHIYDEEVAEEVLATSFEALPYFQDLLNSLGARL